MATLSDEIQSCVLRSLCPMHSKTFERFHSNYPRFKEWIESPEADTSVLVWIFQPFPAKVTVERWNLFIQYLKSEEGREYRPFCRHWARYAKLCLEGCEQCYIKAEGTTEERYAQDRAHAMAGALDLDDWLRLEAQYPVNYGTYLLQEARKRKKLVEEAEKFPMPRG